MTFHSPEDIWFGISSSYEEFYDAEIEKRQHAVAEAKGFAISDHALSLYAHCTKTDCPHRPTRN
mgnify:CR=1 FL=1